MSRRASLRSVTHRFSCSQTRRSPTYDRTRARRWREKEGSQRLDPQLFGSMQCSSSLCSPQQRQMASNNSDCKTEGNGGEKEFVIMVNGGGGKMGQAVAEAAIRRGHRLHTTSLSGSSSGGSTITLSDGKTNLSLIVPNDHLQAIHDAKEAHPKLVIVDYSLPAAIERNVQLYCENNTPFVLGTTGGDRSALIKMADDSKTPSVIAPQMGKQIVAMQAMLQQVALDFPGAFDNYVLQVRESHQSTKVDTSGTAKAVVESFKQLGTVNSNGEEFSNDDIVKVRTEAEQVAMGVPQEHLAGHAFHTYSLTSPDGLISFQFQHNVCARSVYADGTIDAVEFLAERIWNEKFETESEDKNVYSMIDVLRAGAMR